MPKDNIEQKQHLIDLMNMEKQEVIKQAYGDFWESLRLFIDENGWCNYFPNRIGNVDWEGTGTDFVKYRPKSLQGIENNNGWISFDVMPKDDDKTYYFTAKVDFVFSVPQNYKMLIKRFSNGEIDRYQPIQKPLKPLY
jgi:hypothetical protein